jgi:hypothetical protein
MNQPGRLLKGAVIASSLLLGTAFVLYRSGTFGHIDVTEPRTAMAATSMPDSSQADTVKRPARRYFPGSKSGPVFEAETNDTVVVVDTTVSVDTVRPRERFMGGSKSLAPLVLPPEDSTRDAKR